MSKAEWSRHMAEVPFPHNVETCPVCLRRVKTIKANAKARAIRLAYRDLGMVRVKGSLGGVYYE